MAHGATAAGDGATEAAAAAGGGAAGRNSNDGRHAHSDNCIPTSLAVCQSRACTPCIWPVPPGVQDDMHARAWDPLACAWCWAVLAPQYPKDAHQQEPTLEHFRSPSNRPVHSLRPPALPRRHIDDKNAMRSPLATTAAPGASGGDLTCCGSSVTGDTTGAVHCRRLKLWRALLCNECPRGPDLHAVHV